MKIVIDIPEEDYKRIKSEVQKYGFIAICDNNYPLSEEVIDSLKSTLFVGDTDDSGKGTYCFTMKEIIEGSESK